MGPTIDLNLLEAPTVPTNVNSNSDKPKSYKDYPAFKLEFTGEHSH